MLVIVCASRSASAQPKSDTAAEAVFQEGIAKLDRGDYAAACPLLERAIALSSTEALGGMLTLAECFEHVDKPASAWALYKRVAARAAVSNEATRMDAANAAAARLEPVLPRVRFTVPAAPIAGLVVRHGDDSFPSDVWDVPLPVDPGSMSFRFEAPGFESKTLVVEIPKGSGTTAVAAPSLVRAGASIDAASSTTSASNATPDKGGALLGGVGIAGVVVGAVGIVGVGASAGVMADAKGKWTDAVTNDCDGDPTRCRTTSGIEDARAQGDAASAVFGVGVGLAAVGAALVIVDLVTRPSTPPAKASLVPHVDAAGGFEPLRRETFGFVGLKWSY